MFQNDECEERTGNGEIGAEWLSCIAHLIGSSLSQKPANSTVSLEEENSPLPLSVLELVRYQFLQTMKVYWVTDRTFFLNLFRTIIIYSYKSWSSKTDLFQPWTSHKGSVLGRESNFF